MAQGNFSNAPIDFSMLAKLPEIFSEGQKRRRESDLRTALANVPLGADGAPDMDKLRATYLQHDPVNAMKMAGDSASEFGLQPQFDQFGNAYQLNKGGGASEIQLPGGGRIQPPVNWIDQDTQRTPVTRHGGLPAGAPLPRDVTGKVLQEEQGKTLAGNQAGKGDAISNADTAIKAIDEAIKHPGRSPATGMSGMVPWNKIPGSSAKSYQVGPYKQVLGGAFLDSVQQMKGLGVLSNQEGQAATAAKTGLDIAQTDGDHLRGLYRLKAITLRGKIRAYEKAGEEAPQEVVDEWTKAERISGLQAEVPFQSLKNITPEAPQASAPQQATMMPGAPANPISQGPIPVEPNPSKRVIGQVYVTPDGKQYLWAQDNAGVGWEPLDATTY